MSAAEFPIPLQNYKAIALNPANPKLTAEQREILRSNIQLCRDAIIFFTAIADAKGLGGHTVLRRRHVPSGRKPYRKGCFRVMKEGACRGRHPASTCLAPPSFIAHTPPRVARAFGT